MNIDRFFHWARWEDADLEVRMELKRRVQMAIDAALTASEAKVKELEEENRRLRDVVEFTSNWIAGLPCEVHPRDKVMAKSIIDTTLSTQPSEPAPPIGRKLQAQHDRILDLKLPDHECQRPEISISPGPFTPVGEPAEPARVEPPDMQKTLRLWEFCGGSQHGPHTETVTMPLEKLEHFCVALLADTEGDE